MSSTRFQSAQRNLAYVSQAERDRFAAYVSGNPNHRNIQGPPAYASAVSSSGGGGYYARPAGASARGPMSSGGTHANNSFDTIAKGFDGLFGRSSSSGVGGKGRRKPAYGGPTVGAKDVDYGVRVVADKRGY